MAGLNPDELEHLYTTALARGLADSAWDVVLHDGLGAHMALASGAAGTAADRLRARLLWLNAHPALREVDGPPLAVWLANALRVSEALPAGEVFGHLRAQVLGVDAEAAVPRAEPLPAQPWPLLWPCTDARLFGGREAEVAALAALLDGPDFLIALHAPSGFGKSSFLQAGLLPALQAAGRGAARDETPHLDGQRARLWRRLGRVGEAPSSDEAFVDALPPGTVLVLDQLEEVFKAGLPAAVVGLLQAGRRRAAVAGTPPVRFILSYREEFDGRVQRWLAGEVDPPLAPHSRTWRLPALKAAGFLPAITRPLAAPLSLQRPGRRG